MSKSKALYIFGYSGHSYVLLDAAIENGFQPAGYFDFRHNEDNPYDLKFLGHEKDINLKELIKDNCVFPAVGSNSIRKNLIKIFNNENLIQASIISKKASISPTAKYLESTFIGPNAVVNSLVSIGKACIINTSSVIEHECDIGDYTHIAPGAILAGNVRVGPGCFIGAGSVIREGIHIAENVILGAGTIVVRDIHEPGTYVGCPAKKIK